jgi:hypothetical protein
MPPDRHYLINYLLKSLQCVVLSYVHVSYISIDTHHS